MRPPGRGKERTAVTDTGDKRQRLTEFIVAGQADFYRLAYSYVKDRDTALDVVQ